MSISVVGVIFVIAGVVSWFLRRNVFMMVLSASAAFPTTAAITLGASSIPPFAITALIATVAAVVAVARGARVKHLSIRLLAYFVGWTALVTAVAPFLFQGLLVLDPRGGIDAQIVDPTPLTYSVSMAAQFVYLVFGAGTVLFLAQQTQLHAGYLTTAFAVGTALSVVRVVPAAAPGIDFLFRNYASASYNATELRQFGVFAEPSYLAVFSIAALTYAIYRAFRVRGWRLVGIIAIGVGAGVNLVASGSGTAALSILILCVIAIVFYAYKFLVPAKGWQRLRTREFWSDARNHPIRLWVSVAAVALVVALVVVPNPLRDSLGRTIFQKAGSLSFQNRSGSDLLSIQLLWQTFGLGTGLGANRPSSFATLLLSNVGILGTLLFAAAVAIAIWRARGSRVWAPVIASLIALLVAKVVAEPALSTPLLWLALGGTVYAGTRTSRNSGTAQPTREIRTESDDRRRLGYDDGSDSTHASH
jgi:hypothetical protein